MVWFLFDHGDVILVRRGCRSGRVGKVVLGLGDLHISIRMGLFTDLNSVVLVFLFVFDKCPGDT